MIDSVDKFLVAGDWHGNYHQAERVLNHAKKNSISVIVHVGDFGIWDTDKPFLNKLQKYLHDESITLYFIDGNHENFTRLYDKKILEDGTRRVRNNIFYLPRGYRWQWNNVSFMGLGGAVSINKSRLKPGKSWWPQEELTLDDVDRAIAGGPVDVMFCHDSPSTAPNTVVDSVELQAWATKRYGQEIMDKAAAHRARLANVTNIVTPKMIFHGHYHSHMSSHFKHEDEKASMCKVIGLSEGIAPEDWHTFIFDFEMYANMAETFNTYVE